MADSESIHWQLDAAVSSPAELIDTMTPQIHANLKEAVALRRWPDGSRLSAEQLENAMQLIILYEHAKLPPDQHTGQKLTSSCSSSSDAAEPLTIKMDTDEQQDKGRENSGS